MIIDIDDALLTPRIMTMVRELVDVAAKPGVEVIQSGKGIKLEIAPKYAIVARSYYRAQEFIFSNGYNPDECRIILCDARGQFDIKLTEALVVEFADYVYFGEQANAV